MGLFGPRLPIDADELEWQLATFKWLEQEFGPVAESELVLPTPRYFAPSPRKGQTSLVVLIPSEAKRS